jgi:hypothetical protein
MKLTIEQIAEEALALHSEARARHRLNELALKETGKKMCE